MLPLCRYSFFALTNQFNLLPVPVTIYSKIRDIVDNNNDQRNYTRTAGWH